MDDGNDAEAANAERWETLKNAKQQLLQYSRRKVGKGENDWSRAWISDVCEAIIEVIAFGQINGEKRRILEYLIDHPLMDFRSGEQSRLPSANWTAEEWFSFLDIEPYLVLKVFEKCAGVLPLDCHKTLVRAILENVTESRLEVINRFAPDVIRISFAKCEAILDKKVTFSAFQACRVKAFRVNITHNRYDKAYMYIDFWRTLMMSYPKDSVNWSAEMLVGYDPSNPLPDDDMTDKQCSSPAIFILNTFLKRKNVFFYEPTPEMIRYKKSMLKLWESLDFSQLYMFFSPEQPFSLLDKLFESIKNIVYDQNREVIDSLSGLLNKLIDHALTQNFWQLKTSLDNLRNTLLSDENRSFEALRMAVQISYECGELIDPISKQDLFDFGEKLFLENKTTHFDNAVLYAKAYRPNPDFEQLEKIGELLGYGSESYSLAWDQDLTIKQIKNLAEGYRLELELHGGKLFRKKYECCDFGRNELTHETFPNFFNLISSLVMAQIGTHVEELTLPENKRKYLNSFSGLRIFDRAVDMGLSLILDTVYNNLDLLNSKIQVEGAERLDIFNQQLRYYKNTFLSRRELYKFSMGMNEEVKSFLQGENMNLVKYFLPLAEMVVLSVEVLDFKRTRKDFFEHFYVPVIRALLTFAPDLAMQLIVAFCRAELKLHLRATFPNTDRFKTDWQRIKDLKTPEVAKQHFESIPATRVEVYATNAPFISHNSEMVSMDRFVAAAVNHYELYDTDATSDYLVITHYYKILEEKGIRKEELENMDIEDVHDLLLPQEDND